MSEDKEIRKKRCRSLFNYLGENPGTWWLSSIRLKDAADCLRDECWPNMKKHHDQKYATADFRIGPVYMLLMGMAVESGLKAIMVAKNYKLIEEQKISKNFDFNKHHLKNLWCYAGITKVKCRQLDSLLDRLENFVIAFGRYPITKNKQDMDKMIGSSFHGETDFVKVSRLWKLLENHAEKTIPALSNMENSSCGSH